MEVRLQASDKDGKVWTLRAKKIKVKFHFSSFLTFTHIFKDNFSQPFLSLPGWAGKRFSEPRIRWSELVPQTETDYIISSFIWFINLKYYFQTVHLITLIINISGHDDDPVDKRSDNSKVWDGPHENHDRMLNPWTGHFDDSESRYEGQSGPY